MENLINKKFTHNVWFLNADLTIKDFLELVAEKSCSFYLTSNTLKDEEQSGSYKLTKEEKEYYLERKTFYKNFKKDFYEKNKNLEFAEFCNKERKALLSIEDYKIAYEKFKKSLTLYHNQKMNKGAE